MIDLKNIYLVVRNARDKVQVANAILSQDANTFYIQRFTFQFGGVISEQPVLTITQGKAKRSPIEQAELEYNSIIKKYQDKGYKLISDLTKKSFEELEANELDSLVPSIKSDSSGILKPMLAKEASKVSVATLNKKMYCSKKLNGVRAMPQKIDNNIVFASRGGKEYLESVKLIRKELEQFFKDYPDIILDGEIYKHGHYLQEISGLARRQEWDDKCHILEYWIYDIVDPNKTFEERLEFLKELPEYFENNSKIKVLDHIETNSFKEMKDLHDKWVKEGYEGLVARKPNAKYGAGRRSADMVKLKEFFEEEFEIIDYSEGLRDEDFCFVCQTKEGKAFEAKPVGDRELKAEYLENMDNIIGKMGTVKFFEWSKEGVPTMTVFQSVRDYE